MSTRLRLSVSFLCLAFLGGCGGGGDGAKCVPGLTVSCPCPTGQNGAQTCTSAGNFAACVCASPGVDSGGLGGSGGTTAASSAAGTGGQGVVLLDAGPAGTGGQGTTLLDAGPSGSGGAANPITIPVDASQPLAETGGQPVVVDAGPIADAVGQADSPDAPSASLPCGDGVISGNETCDDGNTLAGDGCSATCHVEAGHKCSGSPSTCTRTVCGDGKKEGTEGCDDGNTTPFDGCSEDCQVEPSCTVGNGCTSRCGDGIVLGEDCDDGNAANGDGCSSDCKVEPGWTCKQPDIGDTMKVPVIYRDFKFSKDVTGGNDFENGVSGSYNPVTGILKDSLDANGKPVYTGLGGNAHILSATSFSQWYTSVSGVNHATASKLPLWNNGSGAYVNRYKDDGTRWLNTEIAYYCGSVGSEATDSDGKPIPCTRKGTTPTNCDELAAKGEEMLPGSCVASSAGDYSARFIVSKMDGNPLFFPVDGDNFSPASEATEAQIPPYYDVTETWPKESQFTGTATKHNFSFTSEIRFWFRYEAARIYNLEFVGDEDLWVFINGRLAVDIGGIHTPVKDSIALDATAAGKLGLSDGNVYEIAVFHAERQTTCVALEVTLPPFNISPSECKPM